MFSFLSSLQIFHLPSFMQQIDSHPWIRELFGIWGKYPTHRAELFVVQQKLKFLHFYRNKEMLLETVSITVQYYSSNRNVYLVYIS
jgi:hypothetical protein